MNKSLALAPLAVALLATTALADVEAHKLDRAHSSIEFKSYTKLFDVKGKFKKWSADAKFDPSNMVNSKVNITIRTKSVDTDNNGRDDHLRNEDFFHTEKYPTAKFTSTKFKKLSKDSFEVEGKMTIRGVTKKVTIPFQWTEVERSKKDGVKYTSRRAKGQLRVNRHDFNIDYKAGLLLPSVDKKVDIFFDVNFFVPPAKTAGGSEKKAGGW